MIVVLVDEDMRTRQVKQKIERTIHGDPLASDNGRTGQGEGKIWVRGGEPKDSWFTPSDSPSFSNPHSNRFGGLLLSLYHYITMLLSPLRTLARWKLARHGNPSLPKRLLAKYGSWPRKSLSTKQQKQFVLQIGYTTLYTSWITAVKEFAAKVFQKGMSDIQHHTDTLLDLYFRLTVGTNPILGADDVPKEVVPITKQYENNRRLALLQDMVDIGGLEWQQALPLPRTAIGISKLRALVALANECVDFKEVRRLIDSELAKRPPAPPDQQKAPLVSRNEIQSATDYIKEAKRVAAAEEERIAQIQSEAHRQAERQRLEQGEQRRWEEEEEERQRLNTEKVAAEKAAAEKAAAEKAAAKKAGGASKSNPTVPKKKTEQNKAKGSKASQPKVGFTGPSSRPQSLWEHREEHGPFGSPTLTSWTGDADKTCAEASSRWQQEVQQALQDYIRFPAPDRRTRLDEACRGDPSGLKEAFGVIQAGLPGLDWHFHKLPHTIDELRVTNRQDPLPGPFNLEQGEWRNRLQVWEESIDALKTITENTIVRSKDDECLALYFKAGMNSEETGLAHRTIKAFLRTWDESNAGLPNPRELTVPKWAGLFQSGEIELTFAEGLSEDFVKEKLSCEAAFTFLRDIEPMLCRREGLDKIARERADFSSLFGSSRGIHTGFHFLNNVQQPPSLTPSKQTTETDSARTELMITTRLQVNLTVMTAFSQGPVTGGEFLVGTRYHQYKFSSAPGALLFFRGDLLYHATAVTRTYEPSSTGSDDEDEDPERTTFILEPHDWPMMERERPRELNQGGTSKPLAADLMNLV
ncbi:hypothetical protein HD553DRAFT_323979 [Filobasidium floriforme]|uniref:uncharacterized protein n=1 Tax=Filobasidium floriforme TaxID=5210 RepID=UPI001E8E6AE9|nr:uncharacterized protein HD553DRAFT_323979 [Filobasidium floriforme]KAH8084619.1 hypothetical protein HD553DRAFT_323979 [Filobasidium floriforme]